MAGQTAGKLPYPTGTDKVRDGDNAIQALAEAVTTMHGAYRLGFFAGSVTTGADGRVWVPVPGLVGITGSLAIVVGTAKWTARPVSYGAPNQVLVEVLQATDANIVPSAAMGLAIFAWGPP